jgi:hypothetical protein
MTPNGALREIAALVRAVKAGGAGQADALRRLKIQSDAFEYPADPLDADAALRELLDAKREVSIETRYALAQWINGHISEKRGRKPGGTPRARHVGAKREPLNANLCVRALLSFASTALDAGLRPSARLALADLLIGARELKRGPRKPAQSFVAIRAALSVHNVRLYHSRGLTVRAAIRRAALDAGIKPGTLQKLLYPRTK